MARYRVGDKYLSEEEYRKHQDSSAAVFFFFLGFVIAGYLAHRFSVEEGWDKAVRFAVVVASGITGGSTLAALRDIIGMVLGFAILVGVVGGTGYILWRLV